MLKLAKYAVLVALFAAVAFATQSSTHSYSTDRSTGSGGTSGHDESDSLSMSEFRHEMTNVQNTALDAANRIDGVLQHAMNATMDSTGQAWVGFEENFKSMMDDVGEAFDQETERMKYLIERFWDSPKGFVQVPTCDNVASLYRYRAHATNLEQELVFAMVADLGCLKEEFTSAEHIPIDAMVDGHFSELDAVQVIQGTFQKMFEIKRAGEAFGHALEMMDKEMNGGGSSTGSTTEMYDKRTIQQLLRFLKSFSDRK